MSHQSSVAQSRARFAERFAFLLVSLGGALPAHAYLGESLLNFAKNNIIAPLGLLAVVVALGASIFRPDLVKTAIYTAIICAVLFFLINSASTFINAVER